MLVRFVGIFFVTVLLALGVACAGEDAEPWQSAEIVTFTDCDDLKVKLEGVKSNRSAIGARVLVRYEGKKQVQALLSQSSFYSCNDPRLHFGLGPAKVVDVDVFWPSGLHETYKRISANQLLTLREGGGPIPSKGWAAR